MEFRDLKKQYMHLKKEIDEQIATVIREANYILGGQVTELEGSLAEFVGTKYCITCANGTDALLMALKTWGVGSGDAVFVPDFTFFSSGEVVAQLGAVPIFVDVREDTFNIDVDSLESAIKLVIQKGQLKPKVIMTVDLFGLAADYLKVEKIAQKYSLKVLEDSAQGFGGRVRSIGKRAGAYGEIGTTSFFPAKPLGCYGDGGGIFTDNESIADLLFSLRLHGKGKDKYDNIRLGMNSRLDTLQAAILNVKLKAFCEYELADINLAAQYYMEKFKEFNRRRGDILIKYPIINDDFYSSWAQYTIVLENEVTRNELQKYLKTKDIPTLVYYKKPMHLQKAFSNITTKVVDLSQTEKLCKTVLSLPLHPYMEEDDQEKVVQEIGNFFEHIVKRR